MEEKTANTTELTALLVVAPSEVTSAARFYRQVFGATIVNNDLELAEIMIGSNLLIITCPSRPHLSAPMLCLRLGTVG
ncbi:unnamed protein product [Prunus armeniaca]|uniref:Glyoxalase/fosfomycin resistance/dioxygenase domain-containing protein n=1 Tax=Prunus armeniaca TaxID=36596 RepID=A0A6J5XB21_PRUAR|nr:unnamed protein product [Prunus armeniaca]CAB4311140.1 unnamed protein product [Prunus armeniaca]